MPCFVPIVLLCVNFRQPRLPRYREVWTKGVRVILEAVREYERVERKWKGCKSLSLSSYVESTSDRGRKALKLQLYYFSGKLKSSFNVSVLLS